MSTAIGRNDSGALIRSTACGSDFTANTCIPSTTAASRAFASGTTTFVIPRSRAASAAESAPRTERTPPSSDSSPRKTYESRILPKNVPWQPSTPSAIGRSNAEPSLRISAGARFTVTILREGKIEAAVPQRGLDSLAAFFHGDVRQSDDVETALIARTNVHLNLDEVGVDSEHSRAECFEEHSKWPEGGPRHLSSHQRN